MTLSATTEENQNGESELHEKLRCIPGSPGTNEKSDLGKSVDERIETVQAALELASDERAEQDPGRVEDEKNAVESEVRHRKVMIVDDEEVNVLMVRQHLMRAGYENFVTTCDSREAMDMANKSNPDLVLLDINMPHVSGMEILEMMSKTKHLRNIPVVVLTAATAQNVKQSALELGANDFLHKPVDPNELIARVRNSLTIKIHFDNMASQQAELERLVKKRTAELYQSRQQVILSLARAAEHRDNETGNHVLRVGYFAAIIAQQLGWPKAAVEMIQQAAQLHDVGKIGVPDSVLFKPGKLDENEYDIMKRHCALGKQIIAPYNSAEGQTFRSHTGIGASILEIQNSPLMKMAARIAQSHHEQWDGSGYPLGLAGEDIPIESRITAVADVYDALSSKRPYKDAFPREKCFAIMNDMKGSHFDPKVLDAFFAASKRIIEVQLAFMDEVHQSNEERTQDS